jgi:hypothetical protein
METPATGTFDVLNEEYLRYYVSTTAVGDVAMKSKQNLHAYKLLTIQSEL